MRVLIADDHPVVCEALTALLSNEVSRSGVEVEAVASGDALLEKLATSVQDLIILDLHMPGSLQSIPLLAEVASRYRSARILVYTGKPFAMLAVAALELGAKGYVLKSSRHTVLVDAVDVVAAGGNYLDPAIDLAAARSHPWYQLTQGEREVLLAIARGKSLRAVAIEIGRSYKTIATRKYVALRKLGLRSKSEIGPYLSAQGLDYLLE